jgi:predicted AlkP superfamily pyrophosphatase or phosphodiesterase
MTTGSIPSFVDLILNFDEADTSSTLASQDTWLAQIKAKDMGKLLMYGDDTWLKLFPNTFDREDGTSSFFVAVCQFQFAHSFILANFWFRISPRWTITLPETLPLSWRITTGVLWFFIILV